ncbi:hypothetical protein OAZ13_02265 [Gammaproteobacteria bacterium]|nr:hypothetical protein [Gammaproteobacteria bacterium]
MLNPEDRSKAFNFALKAQEVFGFLIVLTVLWSIYALIFTQIELLFISKVLLTLISVGFGTLTPLIDFNESHATNPLWTGHARFHLVWQVNAMIITALLSITLLWFFYSITHHLIVILLNFLWIFSFFATVIGLRFFDGELNDINGVPPVFITILGREYEIDRNIQAITGSLVVISYATALFFV